MNFEFLAESPTLITMGIVTVVVIIAGVMIRTKNRHQQNHQPTKNAEPPPYKSDYISLNKNKLMNPGY